MQAFFRFFRNADHSIVSRAAAGLTALGFVILTAACTSFPQQELTSYREAYLEAQKAGDLLYDELALALVRSGKVSKAVNCVRGTGTPRCFDPNVARDDGVPADLPSIRARRLALNAVETYNLAIVDILEGKRGDALATRIENLRLISADLLELGRISGGALPALITGQSAALLGVLVKRLDKVVSEQDAKVSLIENAELVRETIQLLTDDTPRMYKLYRRAQGAYGRSLENSDGSVNKAAIAAYRKIGAYHDQLTAYVKLLDQTRSSFDQLIVDLETGTPTSADVRANIREAIEIRNAAENFWAEVRKAQ